MPNPKTGTVHLRGWQGRSPSRRPAGSEYRTDRGANVHLPIGKKSFDERSLIENYAAVIEEIVRAKPAVAKGRYIRAITLREHRWAPASTSTRRGRRGSSTSLAESDGDAAQEAATVTA
jgi:ribosomal protein L1